MHLKPVDEQDAQFEILEEQVPVQFSTVYEIAETDGAYGFGWNTEGAALFSVEDVQIGLDRAREEGSRVVFLTFPSNFGGISDVLSAAGFAQAGALQDYYDDGVHEDHYRYSFESPLALT